MFERKYCVVEEPDGERFYLDKEGSRNLIIFIECGCRLIKKTFTESGAKKICLERGFNY